MCMSSGQYWLSQALPLLLCHQNDYESNLPYSKYREKNIDVVSFQVHNINVQHFEYARFSPAFLHVFLIFYRFLFESGFGPLRGRTSCKLLVAFFFFS